MTERQLRRRIGIALVISHFSLIILVLFLYFLDGFLFEEMTTTIALIIPMFGVYTSAVTKTFLANKTKKRIIIAEEPITIEYTFINIFPPALFILALTAIIILKVFNVGLNSFEEFKITLAVIEGAFGAYSGRALKNHWCCIKQVEPTPMMAVLILS